MTVTFGLGLCVLCALAWGALDAVRKQLAQDLNALPLATWLVLGQWPVFGVWVALSGQTHMTSAWLLPGLSVSALALLGAVLFVQAVKVSPLSLVVPMLAFTPAFAVLTGYLLVGEVPAPLQLAGIGLVVTGALALTFGRRAGGGRGLREPGVWMMLTVALLWACTIALDKQALAHADVPIHALAQGVAMGTGLLGILAVRRELDELRGIRPHLRLYVIAVGLQCLATALQLLAVTVVLVSIVEGIKRATGLGLALFNGWWWFGEPVSRSQVAAVTLMATGALLLVV
jgi:drug/metabolite transporter (DMT)-like permease